MNQNSSSVLLAAIGALTVGVVVLRKAAPKKLELWSCDCDCERGLLATDAPSAAIDSWTVYFTVMMDSYASEPSSYVWYVEDYNADLVASVLLDSTGSASGLRGYNETTLYFSDSSGSIWTITKSGDQVREIFSYDGRPQGLDIHVATGTVYWADLDGAVYSVDLEGTSFATVTASIAEPYDVAVSPRDAKLYVSDLATDAVVRCDFDGANLETFVSVTSPRGIWADVNNNLLYFASYSDSYIGAAAMSTGQVHVVFDSSELGGAKPVAVGVDYLKSLLFYATTEALIVYSLETGASEVVVYLNGIVFLWVNAYIAPTPAPTALPTSVPSPQPSRIPTALPSSAPTATPSQLPSMLPCVILLLLLVLPRISLA